MPRDDTTMDFLTDSVEYNVAQFYEEFSHKLPVMATVTQGFLGDITQDTFDKDQVLRIHTESRQKRVVVQAKQAGYRSTSTCSFSMPVTYHAKFCIVNKHGKAGKEELSLADIADNEKLPITVQFAKKEDITVGNRRTSTTHFPTMKLVNVFDEVYLLGNFVIEGAFTVPVVPIPLYLSRMRLAKIVGIKGQERLYKFTQYLDGLSNLAKRVTYDPLFGNKDIAVYGPETIALDTAYAYIEPQTYTSIDALFRQRVAAELERYEPLQHTCTDAAVQPTDNVYEEINNPPKERTRLLQELKHVGMPRTLNKSKGHSIDVRTAAVAPKTPHKPPVTNSNVGSDQPPTLPQRRYTPRDKIQPSDRSATDAASAPYENDIPRGQIRPTIKSENTLEENNAQLTVTVSNEASVSSPNTFRSVTDMAGGVEKRTELDVERLPKTVDVSSLTIAEVCEWMKYLKLDKYCDAFREQMIDGEMLIELNREILMSEFGMSVIESLRTVKFAKEGHIPK